MDKKVALELHLLASNDPDKASALLQHFIAQREEARDRLEDANTNDERCRLQGMAQAYRDMLSLFEEATQVTALHKKREL